ncbi:MAG: Gfo/Idh/MocA family oxidoreductase, partial [Anaerolineae bacterium]|nr:Gfo/Idh/MocA family oxidoreductase [Anaerolineae bacterium]
MPFEALNVGLIGAGRIGRVHAHNLTHFIPTADIGCVADERLGAAEECARENRIERAVADYRAVLDDPTVDAVMICSSTHTHARIIEEAA